MNLFQSSQNQRTCICSLLYRLNSFFLLNLVHTSYCKCDGLLSGLINIQPDNVIMTLFIPLFIYVFINQAFSSVTYTMPSGPELSTGRMDPRAGSGRVTILPDFGGSGRIGSGRVSTSDF